ncbi:AbrB family transcriptional regulator [Selenomonadales bacterium OttesenSCG-928-I06]|nr:AbrB family transcriptional regulator [Selenomonadales bacterium OttesenSCG-928-I06]
MIINYLKIFCVACLVGWLFSIANLPLPWMLGPLVTVVILEAYFKKKVYWKVKFRHIGMLFFGYVMGSPFNMETCKYILSHIDLIFVMTLITLGLSLLGGILVKKITNINLATSLIGSIPGGLSQMAVISEEVKEADASTVILMQTVRVLVTVSFIPFLVLYGLSNSFESVVKQTYPFVLNDLPQLLIFAVAIVIVLFFTRNINIPTRYLTIPIVVTALLVLSGFNAPKLPSLITIVAQVAIGINMGQSIDLITSKNWRKILCYNCLNVLGVICILLFIDYIYTKMNGLDLVTMFISTAPGGIAEMGITALMINADLAMVTSFQLFRMLFILFVGIPFLRWWLNKRVVMQNETDTF